jgi:carboxymethylenebutenolidase
MKRRLAFLLLLTSTALPAFAQDWAKPRLEKSPRHLEFVDLDSGGRKLHCFVAYPEVKNKATVIVLIHEIFGLTDWARGMADQLAEAGYIVVEPDLLSGLGPHKGGTPDLGGDDGARAAIGTLSPAQVTTDLKKCTDYALKLPAGNGKVVVGGFCWGGTQTFRFATNEPRVKAAFPFYGTAPDEVKELARIKAPVYGFYAGNDARVTSTVAPTTEHMKKAGKHYEPVVYDGAGHGFMRAGEAPDASEPNKKARAAAWKRWLGLLKKV